jgi:hypothetical protein
MWMASQGKTRLDVAVHLARGLADAHGAGAYINFATPELLFRLLTEKR